MSRGLGTTQRLIITTLEKHGPYFLAALAGGDMDVRYKAIHRAALKLESAGRVAIASYCYGSRKLVICHPGQDETKTYFSSLSGAGSTFAQFTREEVEANTAAVEASLVETRSISEAGGVSK